MKRLHSISLCVATALSALAVVSVSGCGSRTALGLGEPAPANEPEAPAPADEEPPNMSSAPSVPSMPNLPSVPNPPSMPNVPSIPPMAAAGAPAMAPMEPMQPVDDCQTISVTIDELRPTVTLLVDQSGSMYESFPDDDSDQNRWTVVRQALLDEKTGVVKGLEQSIQFGLSFYTSHNGFKGGACPILTEVQAATNGYAAISKLYENTYPDDDTPTGPAITQVVKNIKAAGRKGPEVILLVTDGDPDTCEVPDPQGGQGYAVSAAAAAHVAGIDFYVLGVASDISGDKLQQLANAGQGKRLSAVWGVDEDAAQPFQASHSVKGLSDQLRDILARVPLCEIALDRDVTLEEVTAGTVDLDGDPLLLGDPDGFELDDSRRLQVLGKACEKLRATGKRLQVRIACD